MISSRLHRVCALSVGRSGRSHVHFAAKEIDSMLRTDVKLLGKILGSTIKSHDARVFENVEVLRKLGREWRRPDGQIESFQQMVEKVKTMDGKMMHDVSRSFTNFLALANSAENHHRMRKLRSSLIAEDSDFGLWPKIDSCGGGIANLLARNDGDGARLAAALKSQTVEIVLTAHPTEVNRRTLLRKLHRIKRYLELMDSTELTRYERSELQNKLTAEISSIWGSDFLRRAKPTPVEEARSGLAVVEQVLWKALPSFLRKLDQVSREVLNESLPLTAAPIKMASWMGGDRDGNPNVTPEVTLQVSMLSRWTAASLFLADIAELKGQLSVDFCSEEMRAATGGCREPYREVLKGLESRLQATLQWTEGYLKDTKGVERAVMRGTGGVNVRGVEPLRSSEELAAPLLMMHRSLVQTGLSSIAGGMLTDTIRRVAAFGLSLLPLDLRQESTRHSEALNAITQHLGVGSYMEWDEDRRRQWLLQELKSRRPLLARNFSYASSPAFFTPTVVDTLRTFEVAAALQEGSLGAYVISQCQQASDILAVMLLQQDAGVSPRLRVVPLFETLDDLQSAEATVKALFEMPVYKELIEGKQEIMVGYSDSAKDAGRLAASWAQYKAQVHMAEVARQHGVQLTFFHGKGGTVGRGGNPALYEAILAHPPGTIQGRFRVTEQGEMITQNLGEESVAERTLDLFTAGVLAEGFTPRPGVKPEWGACMDRMSVVSCDAYRAVVRGESRFVPYFRAATPEQELSGLNVGSRPAKRNPKGGVESLRAIPWVFAWTQTRLNLPTWLGVGEALSQELRTHPHLLKEMYREWPWFRTLIDLLEMIIVKSDTVIAANYDTQLVTDPQALALGAELRDKLDATTRALLEVSGNTSLQAHNEVLLNSLAVRNPYVDPLNVIQAELLRRLRSDTAYTAEERAIMQDALLTTINGIANGMRNSG